MARKVWTEAQARVVLEEQARSGESINAFARRHGVTPQRVRWWRDRIAKKKTFALLPARVVDSQSHRAAFEVALRTGHVVRVANDFDTGALDRLVRALEALS
jgi:transposase-like protein